jgi:hypothetical protein
MLIVEDKVRTSTFHHIATATAVGLQIGYKILVMVVEQTAGNVNVCSCCQGDKPTAVPPTFAS